MSLLESNARMVKNLSPAGLWLFIIGRVLVALGLGILAMAYFPKIAFTAAWPLIVAGVIILMFALCMLVRPAKEEPNQSTSPLPGRDSCD